MRFSVGLFASLAAQAVFAAPALVPTKTPSVVVVALDAVKDAQGTLDTQSADLSNFINEAAVPFINTSLRNIASAVQDINHNVTPYLVGIVKPLAAEELANVPVLLGKTQALVESIKDYAATILFGLTTESQKAVASELAYVISIIEPALIPIETLAKGAVLQSTGETKNLISSLLLDVEFAVGAGLGPIHTALTKVL